MKKRDLFELIVWTLVYVALSLLILVWWDKIPLGEAFHKTMSLTVVVATILFLSRRLRDKGDKHE